MSWGVENRNTILATRNGKNKRKRETKMSDNQITPDDAQAYFRPEILNRSRRRALEIVQAVIQENDAQAFRLVREAGEANETFQTILSLAVLVHHHLQELMPETPPDDLVEGINHQLLAEDIVPIYGAETKENDS